MPESGGELQRRGGASLTCNEFVTEGSGSGCVATQQHCGVLATPHVCARSLTPQPRSRGRPPAAVPPLPLGPRRPLGAWLPAAGRPAACRAWWPAGRPRMPAASPAAGATPLARSAARPPTRGRARAPASHTGTGAKDTGGGLWALLACPCAVDRAQQEGRGAGGGGLPPVPGAGSCSGHLDCGWCPGAWRTP